MHSRKGFTLTELLIVVVLIGLLSSAMMMSSTEVIATAKASSIVDSLVNFSMAAMTFYTNSADNFAKNSVPKDIKPYVLKYMHNKDELSDIRNYYVVNDGGKLWAGYDTNSSSHSGSIKQKLKGRAKISGLKGTANNSCPKEPYKDYDNDSFVWIMIR